MSEWDDQAGAVVGVAQGGVSQSLAVPAVITPPISMPACTRPLISFLPLKFSSHPTLFLWFNSMLSRFPPSPRLPTPKTQRRDVLRKFIDQ
jgi:hypothetical protein